ncbi:hypothetical protein SPRG_12383 [Saprolegnia parasitica CBS 223.65]|uniref:Uncharacterized protein n=1 Tax=Saprolegnia parasitica (strain CBS 223.65) TaxID=695850 RepID=A0A067C5Q4_SAPPC|nr:hypothetical protein SPRG_12383 [Saprolegnia parasitica CBS 223.65]KDO21881.1 hypothetical protein SPRG_12383 [Saprolegnia parasitica CBS 223.65]|eukprot:XP_012207436.1 hypothetical protein SPRG_12383 [Saprolegnia parasitica CBS 223.65]
MSVICIGPVCIPIYSLLPFLLLFLQRCWGWLTGKAKVEDEAPATDGAGATAADGSSTLRQRKAGRPT